MDHTLLSLAPVKALGAPAALHRSLATQRAAGPNRRQRKSAQPWAHADALTAVAVVWPLSGVRMRLIFRFPVAEVAQLCNRLSRDLK